MKVVTFDDIRNLKINSDTCYGWISEALATKKDSILPPKVSMSPYDTVFCNVMPSIISIDGKRIGGIKIITRYPGRSPSLDGQLMIFDAETGEFLALMDANWITAMRTGAVAAHSINLLAKSNFKTIGFIGLGNTARATLQIFSDVFGKDLMVNVLKYKGQELDFIERFSNCSNLSFNIVESYDEIVSKSDVVVSAVTYFDKDICSDEVYSNGILLVPIHTRGFTNCDLFFDKIFYDDIDHVSGFKNFSKFKKSAEISDILQGKVKGRESDEEKILAYNIGISIHDVFFGYKIYELLADENSKIEINMGTPTEKFWI